MKCLIKYSDWLLTTRKSLTPKKGDKLVGDLEMYINEEFEIIKQVFNDGTFIVEHNEPQNKIFTIDGWFHDYEIK